VGYREVIIKESVADSIAEIAWFIESKGLLDTAERFSDAVYDFFVKLTDSRRTHAICREPERAIQIDRFTVKFLTNLIGCRTQINYQHFYSSFFERKYLVTTPVVPCGMVGDETEINSQPLSK